MKRKKISLIPIKKTEESLGDVNEYYIAAAQGCMKAKYLLLIAFVVFLVVMLGVYRSYITYDNLAYLLRDFSTSSSSVAYGFEDVSYDEQTNMDFTVYRGELAVAGNEKIELYNSMSSKTFEYKSEMETPILIPSEKYLLAYDLGGKSYSLFTNVTRVLNAQSESVIENASLSDNGAFLLVCRARDSKYIVSYYNSSFENEANYYKSNFVSDATISSDGSQIAIASVDIAGAAFNSVIEFYNRGEENVHASYPCGELYPITLGYFEGGGFYAVCDKSVLFFDENGALISEYAFSSDKILTVDAKEESLVIGITQDVMKDSGRIIMFDNLGNIRYNIDIDHKISDVSHSESFVYVLSSEKLYKYSCGSSGATKEELDCGFDVQFIEEAGESVLAGTKSSATTYFDESKQ